MSLNIEHPRHSTTILLISTMKSVFRHASYRPNIICEACNIHYFIWPLFNSKQQQFSIFYIDSTSAGGISYVMSRSAKPPTTGIESLRSPMPLDNHYTFNIMNPVKHLCRVINYTIALTALLTKAPTSEDNLSTENSTDD